MADRQARGDLPQSLRVGFTAQAIDRAHRIGQTQKVSIMRLLMRHTIEEKMMELKKQKLELYEAVLEGATHHGGGASLTQKDFEFLLD